MAVINGFKGDSSNLCWESSMLINNLAYGISGFSTCTFNWIPKTGNEVAHDACKLYLVPAVNIIQILYHWTRSLKVALLQDGSLRLWG